MESIGRTANIAIGSGVPFEIGMGAAVETYRYHAVVNTLSRIAQKNPKAHQVRGWGKWRVGGGKTSGALFAADARRGRQDAFR